MNEPKIRLKGFSGEWGKAPFSETFDSLKNNSLSRAELSDCGEVKNIHYGDVLVKYGECVDVNKDVETFVKDKEVAKKLHLSCAIKNGDIIFADAAEDNTVGKCSEIIANEGDAIVSGLHTIACRPKKDFAPMYLGYYLNSNAYHDQLLPHIQGTKISSISKKAICQTEISFPTDKNEQQAIASYFQHLDTLIQSTTKKIESLKQVKAASLQSMFPQEGETTPRVRFKGFQGEWEKVAVKDIAAINPKTNIPSTFEYVDLESVVGTEMKSHRTENRSTAPSRAQRLASYGDIFYQTVRPYQKNNFYFDLQEDNNYVFSSGYAQIRSVQNGAFLFALMQQESFVQKVMDNCTGTSFPAINANVLGTLEIKVTRNENEQQKIADYFTNLDSQITLQTQRLEKLKQIKSACLDNMFV